jgi:hypothetical protein
MAVCLTENIALYKIDPASGKLSLLIKVQADFSTTDPSLNQCVLSREFLVTGGDDTKVKLFTLKGSNY